jgi:hypothetical protein
MSSKYINSDKLDILKKNFMDSFDCLINYYEDLVQDKYEHTCRLIDLLMSKDKVNKD